MSTESGTDRRKRTTTGISLFSRLSGASSSMRSRGSSLLSKYQREMMGMQDSDAIRCREWLQVFIEFLLAFSWNCFETREKSQKTMELRGKTPREDTMETLFWLGWASVGNLLVGQLMDSFTGTYFMALFNTAFHFILASLFLIGEMVHEASSEDVYAYLLSHVYLWSVPPIKALGFSRYIYAMDEMQGKGAAFVIHYTFIYNFFGMVGDLAFSVIKDSTPSFALLSAVAFCFNGTVLFLYAYLLRPRPRMGAPPSPGIAIKVWGVIFTALRNKRKFGKKIVRQDWLSFAENKYDKGQIARVKRLLRVFFVALPTAGFLLFTTNVLVIFKEFHDNLKLSGIGVPNYLKWIVATSNVLAVVLVEYMVLPLTRTCKVKVNFVKRFVLGYVSLVFAVTAAAVISTLTEKLPVRRGTGTLRAYSTMEGTVSFNSMQEDFTKLRFAVLKHGNVTANFQTTEQNLFRMAVEFRSQSLEDNDTEHSTMYTQLFSVAPEEVLQYVAIAPSTVLRVPGFLPIKEGPPGNNDRWMPRCFMISFIRERAISVFVINGNTDQRKTIHLEPGKVAMFQVAEGSYVLQYTFSVRKQATAMWETGGLYGVYLFLGLNDYEIDVDKIIPENTNHALTGLVVYIPLGIAQGIGQVALNAFIYFSAPAGLKGIAFGFYMGCAHMTAWLLLVGFHTWHRYITPNVLQIYAGLAFATLLMCLVLFIKYRNFYVM